MEGSPCCGGCQRAPSRLRRLLKSMDPQQVFRLRQLFETVLEEEPWDAARHGRHTGKAWMRCGERVPGYLDTCGYRPESFVQINVLRMVRQLRPPKSISPRRWTPELSGRVEELAAKLEVDPRHRSKLYPPDPANPRPRGWALTATSKSASGGIRTLSEQLEREREEPNGNVASV